MTYKPNEILDGMTREEAPLHVVQNHNWECCWFLQNGLLYPYPRDIGLESTDHTREGWIVALSGYYDAKEAASKPRWVELGLGRIMAVGTRPGRPFEMFWCQAETDVHAEIASTNARRKIEAFIKANGGSGCYVIAAAHRGIRCIEERGVELVGAITCATRELAEAVIERYPDELRLLVG